MSDIDATYFNNTIARDFFQLMTGEMLGSGVGREVWTLKENPDLVVKFETGAQSFQNIMEWEVWERIQFTEHARWFAPCVRISGCGTILIQKRTERLPASRLPKQVPTFFTDLKAENWGDLNGKAVCHDYGYHLLMEKGMSKRMRKVEW